MRRLGPATAAVMAALIALIVAPSVTSAQWNDDVVATAVASAGDWSGGGGGEGGITPGNADTIIQEFDWQVTSATQVCVVLTVVTESPVPIEWALEVDTSVSPWNGIDLDSLSLEAGADVESEGPPIRLVGKTTGGPFSPTTNNSPMDNTQYAEVRICVYSAGIPPIAPDGWYDVTQTEPVLNGDAMCTTLTITGLVDPAEHPFYYGWQTTMDLTEAWAALTDAGLVYTFTSMDPDPEAEYGYAVDPSEVVEGQNTYTLTSEIREALVGAGTHDVTWCLHGTPIFRQVGAAREAAAAEERTVHDEPAPAEGATSAQNDALAPTATPTVEGSPSTSPTPTATPTPSTVPTTAPVATPTPTASAGPAAPDFTPASSP